MDILGSLSNSHWPAFLFNCLVIPNHRSWACISIMIHSSLSTYCVWPMSRWWEYRGEQDPHETSIQAWGNKQENKIVSLYLKCHEGSSEGTAWRTRLLWKRRGDVSQKEPIKGHASLRESMCEHKGMVCTMMAQAHPATQEEEQWGQMKQSSDPSLTVS